MGETVKHGLVKLLIIGDSNVGKSSLLMRFADNTWTSSFITTIGIDYKLKTVEIEGETINLQIWDTAGQERFRTITPSFYRKTHGILVVYDCTDEKSFESIKPWLKSIDENAVQVEKIILGNKCDVSTLEKKISSEQGAKIAQEFGLEFLETSVKSNHNVEEAFMRLVRNVKSHGLMERRESTLGKISVETPSGCKCG